MSNSIKEIIIKFIGVFLILAIIGYFIQHLELNIIKSLAMSFGISLIDFIVYIIRKLKNDKVN